MGQANTEENRGGSLIISEYLLRLSEEEVISLPSRKLAPIAENTQWKPRIISPSFSFIFNCLEHAGLSLECEYKQRCRKNEIISK